MTLNPNILVIIPARGGSKGIPRKNLRSLNGLPLIFYSIKTAISSRYKPDVYVSSEDDEILTVALSSGAEVIKRDSEVALDATTLDPVIFGAFQKIRDISNKPYDLVVTLQPTSPLLTRTSLDQALDQMLSDHSIGTLISVVSDKHLTWHHDGEQYRPDYQKRVNRQALPEKYKETGGFLIGRPEHLSHSNRIGGRVELFPLPTPEGIDIDDFSDWALCEYHLRRKKILFVVSGFREIGLGHVYNTLILASDLTDHEIEFLVDSNSALAFDVIGSRNYTVHKQDNDSLADDVISLAPDVVINDILDTSQTYMDALKNAGLKVVNIEDLGPGSALSDITINAIYSCPEIIPNHYFGHHYVLLRDEFLFRSPKAISNQVKTVLLSFGGVDPNNFTQKVVEAISGFCKKENIRIVVVTGMGYQTGGNLLDREEITISRNVLNISDYMARADIVFTSAGRTTYEVASLGVPAIVLAQNERETLHSFPTSENGFLNLGLGEKIPESAILSAFKTLVGDHDRRNHMSKLMRACDLKGGRNRVNKLIRDVIES